MQGVLDDKLEFERHLERIRTYMAPFANAFEDPKTTEIILNPDGQLWHERFGEPMMPIGILDRHRAVGLMNTIARCLGKELTYDSPLLEGEFPVESEIPDNRKQQ